MAKIFKELKKFLKRKKDNQTEVPYWEYYNRYFFVSEKIKSINGGKVSVLDVGGIKSSNIFEKFGIRNVTSLNVSGDADIAADAQKIPLQDKSFDIVTCIDTLEHVPQAIRNRIILELIRVAKTAVFVVAPIDSAENRRAEDIVYAHLKSVYIEEHRKHGLVDFEAIKQCLLNNPSVGSVKEDFLDNLMCWITLMIGDKLEPSRLYQELYFLENRFCPRRAALSITIK